MNILCKSICLYSGIFVLILLYCSASAQTDSLLLQQQVYNRPFIRVPGNIAAVGGYVEGNTNYFAEDGVTEGFSMELRRFNLFVYSDILDRLRFLGELEFEHGVEEINLETAMLDFEINPALVIRAGILLAPLGGFNQNHDSPKWEFVERPLVATQIIPSTLSEVGFGINGKTGRGDWLFTYDAYLVNGLRDGVILNAGGRTFLPAGKSPEMFGEDNNGTPMYTGRLAARHRKAGEIGFSGYGGIYNTYRSDGLTVDQRRSLLVLAADLHTEIGKLAVTGEAALGRVEVPADLSGLFGERQWGFYADLVYPVMEKTMLGFENASLLTCLRLEFVDYNAGTFASTGAKIFDEITALSAGLGWRPSPEAVFRFNYRYLLTRDILGNPATRTAGVQAGVAAYF